ncbi:hypothetical protein NL676_036021 [Syzygium grande]|nr:hypothetical protein NL676_036021 [Syzygium grande]
MSPPSALSGQCPSLEASLPKPPSSTGHPNEETNRRTGGGHASESTTREAKEAGSPGRRAPERKRKRKARRGSRSTSGFFEGLARQLVEHLEGLLREFLEAVEKMDREREEREEAERRESEAAAGARERALASARAAAIVSCLEKIAGQRRVVGSS